MHAEAYCLLASSEIGKYSLIEFLVSHFRNSSPCSCVQLDWFVTQKPALDVTTWTREWRSYCWRRKQSRALHRSRRAASRYCGIVRNGDYEKALSGNGSLAIWVHRRLALRFVSTGVLSIGACACYASPRSTHSIARPFAKLSFALDESRSGSDILAYGLAGVWFRDNITVRSFGWISICGKPIDVGLISLHRIAPWELEFRVGRDARRREDRIQFPQLHYTHMLHT